MSDCEHKERTLTGSDFIYCIYTQAITQVKSRFTPNVPMIKKCIETLIDKQYLERNEGNRDLYQYVA